MNSLNKVQLIGNIVRDPELKNINTTTLANFTVATSRKYKEEDTTEFSNCVAFGKTAEIIEKYASKGKKVYVDGRLQTSSWEKDGEKKYKTEIIVENVIFLSAKSEQGEEETSIVDKVSKKGNKYPVDNIDINDIPF